VRLLGIVASLRPEGNAELLTRLALATAAAAGAQADILLLRDLKLDFCQGCLACVYGQGCPRPDDTTWLFETAAAYDALLLASPVYWSGPPAPVKTLVDRGVALFPALAGRRQRLVGTICVGAGPEGATGAFAGIPVLNELAFLLGGRLAGMVAVRASWPGEALLDPEATRQVRELTLAALQGRSLPAPAGQCPVCRLAPVPPAAICPFCLYDPSRPEGEGRFTAASLTEHLHDWMHPSRESFLAHRARVREAKARHGAFSPRVVKPDVAGP